MSTPRHATRAPILDRLVFAVISAVGSAGQAVAGTFNGFTEEAAARGLDIQTASSIPWTFGHGVAFVDFDNDGDPDVIALGRSNGRVGVFENDGTGHFIDRSVTSGIPFLHQSSGVAAGDYNADGTVDLFISRWLQDDRLLRNDGNLNFVDVTLLAGLNGNTAAGVGCAWGDYNGDGWLDLHLTNHTFSGAANVPNKLYRNDGNGTFVDVASQLGVNDAQPSFQAVFADIDRDGDLDLYLSTDKGYAQGFFNRLFENVGGAFVEITEASGAGISIDSMGVAVGDFDGNLLPDLYCTNTKPGNVLLLNQDGTTFVDATGKAGIGAFAVGWGTQFFDYDNDGDLDLYVCNSNAPNRLYRQDDRWPTTDVAPALGVAGGAQSYGMALADVEGDGDLDLIVMDLNTNVKLYINEAAGGSGWIRFDIVGEWPNLFAIGAEVELHAGATAQWRAVSAGGSYKSQDETTLHFGLDMATQADQVIVTWPGGQPQRTLTNLPAKRRWTIYPLGCLGDADHDGVVDLLDFIVFAACAAAMDFEPGCEMMDFDGNSMVDLNDLVAFIDRYAWFVFDCNDNGVADMIEIVDGSAIDADGDGRIDACNLHPADLNGDGEVNAFDMLALLGQWGQPTSPVDLNGDGAVNVVDLLALLASWGS